MLKRLWNWLFGSAPVVPLRPVQAMSGKELVRCFANAPQYPCWAGVMQEFAEEKQELLRLAMDPTQPAEVVKCYTVALGRVAGVQNRLEDLVVEAQRLAAEEAKRGEGD